MTIYDFLSQDLYVLNGGSPTTGSAPQSAAQAASAGPGGETSSESIVSGEVDGNLSFIGGFIQSKNFVSGTSGWRLSANGTLEAINATLSGTITATAGTIGGFSIGADYIRDAANSFGMASTVTGGDDVRFWAGDTYANRATADFRVTEAGAVTASSITITGGSVNGVTISGIPNNTGTDISLLEHTHDLVFSVTDADTIAWASGTITLSNGRTFSISGGNTGNMAAFTYIYLDPAVSSTVLQVTTTYSTAMGANKKLIGTAQNHTVTASFIPYGPGQPLIDGSNIGALSIVAGNIAASTITAGKLSVSQLSAITADLGSITAGSITINSGVASIDSSGNAVFKSIQIGDGTRQYSISGSGIFSFGDGSDGDATITSDTSLSSDKYYDDLTVNNGAVLNPNGYRIFVAGVLTLSGNGKISRNGTDGNNGLSGGGGGTGGGAVSLSDGYLKGSPATGGGGSGGTSGGGFGSAGSNGSNTSNSLGSSGVNGGAGGNNSVPEGSGAAGAGGTATASNVKLIANWHLATLLDVSSTGSTVKYDNSASAGGGGGGAGSAIPSAGKGGGGGSGGTSGGIVAIYAKSIVINSGSSITANGGTGGSGGAGETGSNAGGGGGGGGGNGGIIILVYNSLSNSGSITVSSGTGGTGGGKGSAGGGSNGASGSNGSPGVIYQFQISL